MKRILAKEVLDFCTVQGRTYLADGALYLNHSASSVEGKFTGTKFCIDAISEYCRKKYATYIRVEIDGHRKKIMLNNKRARLTFDLKMGEHTFKIIKLTESMTNSFGLFSLECDGEFIKYSRDFDINIEFIGDSISTGYGVASQKKRGDYVTLHQNADEAFPYLVGNALNARFNVIAAGGHALYKSKYAETPLIEMYDNVDFKRNKDLWGKTLFVPDVVVIELGINDFSYLKGLSEADYKKELKVVKNIYKNFIEKILCYGCNVILLYGFYGDAELEKLTTSAANAVGDNKVSCLKTKSIIELEDVCDGHPGKRSHRITADLIAQHIKSLNIHR